MSESCEFGVGDWMGKRYVFGDFEVDQPAERSHLLVLFS